jgi:hypothetical protein
MTKTYSHHRMRNHHEFSNPAGALRLSVNVKYKNYAACA